MFLFLCQLNLAKCTYLVQKYKRTNNDTRVYMEQKSKILNEKTNKRKLVNLENCHFYGK